MAQIKPIKYPNLGIATQIEIKVLDFPTDAKTCNTYWRLLREDGTDLGIQGNYNLTEQEFADWGSNMDFVIECVVKSLPDLELIKIS